MGDREPLKLLRTPVGELVDVAEVHSAARTHAALVAQLKAEHAEQLAMLHKGIAAVRAERDAEAALADRLANALVAFMAADSVGGPNSFDEWNDAMDDAEPKAVAALAAHRAARVGRDEGEQQQ